MSSHIHRECDSRPGFGGRVLKASKCSCSRGKDHTSYRRPTSAELKKRRDDAQAVVDAKKKRGRR